MKVVIFCGGMGLRLQEASTTLPKPLIPVGDQPILLHLMKYYAHFGHTEFVLCLGHRAQAIKEYFLSYNEALQNDFVLDNGGGGVSLLNRDMADWRISFVYTGRSTGIGERLRLVRGHLGDDEYFLANYGDQLTDAPLPDLIARAKKDGKVASLLSVPPPYSTHTLQMSGGVVTHVAPMNDGSLWINGGFFVFRQAIFDYIRKGDDLVEDTFPRLIAEQQLMGYRYEGFWAPMDTLKDKHQLDFLADTARPPWAVWLPADAEGHHHGAGDVQELQPSSGGPRVPRLPLSA
jgi:glucose-1-phosphate cytidylyltransferase